jgi:ferredoxin
MLVVLGHSTGGAMAIPTSRTQTKAEIRIHENRCQGCGLCVSVCKDFSLTLKDKKVTLAEAPLFGCFACGHCMAVCPSGAIEIYGRTLSPHDLFELPGNHQSASYDSLLGLLQRRRSVREFKKTPVEPAVIEKILEAAKTAPMGLPPSDVQVLILDQEQNHAFAKAFCQYVAKMNWLVSGWFLFLMRLFGGKAQVELMQGFVKPTLTRFVEAMKNGENLVTYDAPLAIYFYGSPYSDPADPIVAATYAMIAGEALGLGSCMIGSIHPLIQVGRKAARFRKEQGIRFASREGIFVIFGYPQVRYRQGIRRSFAAMDTRNSQRSKVNDTSCVS